MDPLLAWGKKVVLHEQMLSGKRGARICDRNSPADTKVSEKGGEGREEDAPGMEGTNTGADQEKLEPMGRTHIGKLIEDCLPWDTDTVAIFSHS